MVAERVWWNGWRWGFIAALGGVCGGLVGYWIANA
jgi:membrane protein YqaA with SNARE-associated domain